MVIWMVLIICTCNCMCLFAGIRMHFIRSLACIVGVLLYLAEVTYQDYRPNREPLDLTNKTLSQALVCQ